MKRSLVIAFAAGFAVMAQGQTRPPPPIPHEVDGYVVTRQENNCLECHDKPRNIGKKPAKGQASPAPATHYPTLEGKPAIAGSHFNCTSCHARK
jgi:cytochrome c-type protein NapB